MNKLIFPPCCEPSTSICINRIRAFITGVYRAKAAATNALNTIEARLAQAERDNRANEAELEAMLAEITKLRANQRNTGLEASLEAQIEGLQDTVARRDKSLQAWRNIAINMHAHPDWVRSMTPELLEEAVRSTQRTDPRLCDFYRALLVEPHEV